MDPHVFPAPCFSSAIARDEAEASTVRIGEDQPSQAQTANLSSIEQSLDPLEVAVTDPVQFIRRFCDTETRASHAVQSILDSEIDTNLLFRNLIRTIVDPSSMKLKDGETRYRLVALLTRNLSNASLVSLANYLIVNSVDEQDLARMMIVVRDQGDTRAQQSYLGTVAKAMLRHLIRPSSLENYQGRIARTVLGLLDGAGDPASQKYGYVLCDYLLHNVTRSDKGWSDVLSYVHSQLPVGHVFRNSRSVLHIAQLAKTARAAKDPEKTLEAVAVYCASKRFPEQLPYREVDILRCLCPQLAKYLLFSLPEHSFRMIYTSWSLIFNEVQDRRFIHPGGINTLRAWDQASEAERKHFTEMMVLYRDRFTAGQSDLVPVVVSELERLNNTEAVAILKRNKSKLGAPLVRQYCLLALYRLSEESVSPLKIRESAMSECHRQMIAFRPVLPWEMHQDESPHDLTPTETSRLLIETFETLARSQDSDGIVVLLEAIRDGHPHNQYALAGLLIRATS
ncbi:hypothetical protein SCG7086_BD_00060 [Chlamydiales bacterium SCGC AG-110-P3]|nr:hypothetical protein SCG7086_BD_00060 [Chlamydiales bacterium SCGC AG-110-P3]